jgi:hypothetical protein
MSLQIDDPRLTAFALGETLPEGERQAIRQWLAGSAEARATVEDIRALALDLENAYVADRHAMPASRELANIIEFNAPHPVPPKTSWSTHLLRIAAMLAVSSAVVAVGLIAWAGSAHRPLLTQSGAPTPGEAPPSDQAMLSVGEVAGDDEPTGTTGYAQVRRSILAGHLPPRETVSVAELVNHFSYHDEAPPVDAMAPLAVHLEVAGAPWQQQHRLVRIHLKGRERGTEANSLLARNLTVSVNFNPSLVAAYRRIGGESSVADRREDRVFDAREVSAGYAATELYEVIPVGSPLPPLESSGHGWQRPGATTPDATTRSDLLGVALNFQSIDGASVTEAFALSDDGRAFEAASADFRFAAAVAGFALLLRDSPARGEVTPALIAAWAQSGRTDDPGGERAEFIEVVRKTAALVDAAGSGPS